MKSLPTTSLVLISILTLSQAATARIQQQNNLQPAPSDPTTIESQLKRFKGQTQFLNASGRSGMTRGASGGAASMSAKSANESQGGARRDQQESDIFKVGKTGSKLLYLLNDARGLQAVSFAAGVTAPALLGRAAPSGNYPENMYYDQKSDRLIVLERLYYDAAGNYAYSTSQSRAVVYDVSKPEAPRVAQELAIDGEIADSRLVGDVLYVATSVRPDWNDQSEGKKAKGYVFSINVGQGPLAVIEKAELALPASSRENMNIVEIEAGGKYQYYLVAILSQSGWGWWDRQSLVEVVDISDPKGNVKPLMVVSAKGSVNERSQTSIKNNTLIVVSNYRGEERDSITRIAVETFKLPSAQSETISEDEATFRKLNIDRQLKTKTGQARDDLYAQLVKDETLGLQNRFVKTASGQLRKLLADSVVTVGDTNGLHASLQDVRFEDNLLYVFWVPANNVDPFDLFDISQPEKEIKYIKRLQFDGWIARAIPVKYQNRNFVLGLGHVVPNVNQETNRRYPQAMLFEITGQGANSRAVDVAQLTLSKGDLWTDFNGADKTVEVKFGADGSGSLMFEVYARSGNSYVSGGKLIHFDLAAAASGNYDKTFTEGGLLIADSGWLKRVFTNPEIDRVNTFSNTSLATYDVGQKIAADATGKAIHILELARDIEAYVDFQAQGQAPVGVQIINQQNGSDSKTVLRLVSPDRADAEKSAVKSELILDGSYQAHIVDARDNSLVVATHQYVQKGEGENRNYEVVQNVHRISLNATVMSKTRTDRLPEAKQNGRYYGYSSEVQFVKLKLGAVLVRSGSDLYRVNPVGAEAITINNCATTDRNVEDIQIFQGVPYVGLVETVKDATRAELQYQRHFIAPIQISGQSAVCGAAINIPGKVISITDSHIVTEDARLVDIVTRSYQMRGEGDKIIERKYYDVTNENALESLKLAAQQATLVDDYELGQGDNGKVRVIGQKLGYFDSQESQRSPYGRRYGGPSYYASEPSTFVSIGFDRDLNFTRELFVMPAEFLSSGTISDLFNDPSEKGAVIGVITENRQLQVVRWSATSGRPAIVKLSALDVRFEKQTAADKITLPQGIWSYGYRPTGISFNPTLRSIQIPQSLAGVVQVYLQ